MKYTNLDVQGHRGARGLLPENTIPAFIKAIELGVTTLELDLAVTKDHELLVSHDPFMSSKFSTTSEGHAIGKTEELSYNIYKMTYEEIKSYDVGTRYQKHFPDQEKMKAHKPLLKEVVVAVNSYLNKNQLPPVRYNIEIKSEPTGDSTFHPAPAEYAKLVYDFITTEMDTSLLNVQSFDFRILQYFHENYPEIKLAVLVENPAPIEENLANLGFIPDIYSCYYHLLDSNKVAWLQTHGMKVIPWTVNKKDDIKKVLNWGVDGIISDYPNHVLELISD
ncbi:glycerophosphodiester phosphodiesterase family protein [Reichenbachiella carrageenanivorans]|uniref:Glycerophosphodiester phosphodiesterase family protein n=1 Tax=Reichenbachiella carrageenanivorans TaxID=2979869 RepID=A0ABY6D2E5_9BACT|nr:glycerophosphodiester phosphodiesterase family protein [Reichenbachiella carrageenanivorans]UXX80335.1 glycerophosphodiester phosphodiesterase family protein [Reichenbachiella carrageenanivorans]